MSTVNQRPTMDFSAKQHNEYLTSTEHEENSGNGYCMLVLEYPFLKPMLNKFVLPNTNKKCRLDISGRIFGCDLTFKLNERGRLITQSLRTL